MAGFNVSSGSVAGFGIGISEFGGVRVLEVRVSRLRGFRVLVSMGLYQRFRV